MYVSFGEPPKRWSSLALSLNHKKIEGGGRLGPKTDPFGSPHVVEEDGGPAPPSGLASWGLVSPKSREVIRFNQFHFPGFVGGVRGPPEKQNMATWIEE